MNNSFWLFKIIKNKYIIASVAFVVWILFFDRNDVFTQWERKAELNKLETSKEYYQGEITSIKKELADLDSDPEILEKIAREKFFLKKANEDVFIVEDSNLIKK
jgi:cell division protein FtsB